MNLNTPMAVARGGLTTAELDAAIAEKLCPCFAGTCRGGQTVNGGLSNGLLCRRAVAAERIQAQADGAIAALRSLPSEITEGCDALGLEATDPAKAARLQNTTREWRWLPVAGVLVVVAIYVWSAVAPWGFGK